MQLRHGDKVFALRDGKMRELLRSAAREIVERGVVLDDTGENFEVGDASRERIVGGTENVNRRRLRIGHLALGFLAVAGSVWGGMDGSVLGCRGTVVHDEIQQVVRADVAQAGSEQYRKNLVVANRLVQRGNQMLLGDGPLVEKFFHQLVFAFSNKLHK